MYFDVKIIDMIEIILDFFRIKSPCCGIKMSNSLDMQLDKLIYQCNKCGKEWI